MAQKSRRAAAEESLGAILDFPPRERQPPPCPLRLLSRGPRLTSGNWFDFLFARVFAMRHLPGPQSLVYFLLMIAGFATVARADEEIRLATDPALSPDGQTLAFSWRGDLWKVPVAG